MNNQDELTGTLVLVHPKLKNDPANKKNKVGMIESFDLENDTFLVGFGNQAKAVFTMDALLVLRDPEEIQADLDDDATLLPFYDYNDIAEVLLFAGLPEKEYRRAAIELAQKKCPEVLEYTVMPLKDKLPPKQQQYISR